MHPKNETPLVAYLFLFLQTRERMQKSWKGSLRNC